MLRGRGSTTGPAPKTAHEPVYPAANQLDARELAQASGKAPAALSFCQQCSASAIRARDVARKAAVSSLAWARGNAFFPERVPLRWREPAVGYGIAALAQGIVTALTMWLLAIVPGWSFAGSLGLLATVLVALTLGPGPSLLAALLGAFLMESVVLAPHFSLTLRTPANMVGVLIYAGVGVAISVLPGRVERARREAERVRHEAATRSEQLQTTFEALTDAVMIYDADGRIITSNAAARTFWKRVVPESDPDGQLPVRERIRYMGLRDESGEALQESQWPISRILAGQVLRSEDANLTRVASSADGDIVLAVSGAALRGPHGEIKGAVAVLRDVTEQQRLGRELTERVTELATVVETMPDAVALFGQDGQVVRVNAAFRELFALDDRADFFDLSVEERRERLEVRDEDGRPLAHDHSPLERVLHGGETLVGPNAIDLFTLTPAGRKIELEVVGSPVRAADGHTAGAVLLYRDVTERRRLERRTRESLEALLRMAEALVSVPAPEPRDVDEAAARDVLTASALARRLADLSREVLGVARLSMHSLDPRTQAPVPLAVAGLPLDQERAWFSGWPRDLALRDSPILNEVLNCKPGEVRIVDLTQPPYTSLPVRFDILALGLAPMHLGDQLVGVLAFDHGAIRHTYTPEELDLAGAVARLSAVVVERERLLHEREEARAESLALAAANRRMDEFLSVASHELKTPLTTIMATAQIAERRATRAAHSARERGHAERSEVEALAALAGRVAAAAKRQDRLVTDLLDVSRIQSGRLELRQERIDLAALVADAAEEQRVAHPGRIIALSLPDGPVPVEADQDRIRQVITNYLTNALKYSSADRPVDVQLALDGGLARTTVRDHGIGIPPEELELVWDKFQRVGGVQHVSGSSVGLGLGLYIVRELVHRHGGSVGVRSVAGEGSTFWFALPLAAAHPA
jgi:signal transduction histidine kinase